MIREAFNDLNRLREISLVVARHGFGAYLDRSKVWERLGRREAHPDTAAPAPERGRQTAARFRKMLVDLGPTFIKLGQVLSSRPDMLPSHWIDELSVLQDSVDPFPLSEVRAEIERALGKPVEALFAELEEKPLASASIAQVHRARTLEGDWVVVKVQRSHIRDRIESDVALLYYFAKLLEAVIEETGIYTPTGIIEEFDRAIHEELDFKNEARNIREMGGHAKGRDYLVIPRVYEQLSAATVITLEYLEGTKVNDISVEKGHDAEQIAKNLIEGAFRMLFEDGVFHGDPHPGNILVLPGNRIGLLDFGLVGRLTRPMQEALVMLIAAVALKDSDTVARLLYRVGIPEGATQLSVFRGDIVTLLDKYLGLNLDEIRADTLLRDLLDLAIKHKIKIPKEYAILSKASLTLEGIIRKLYPKLDVLAIGLPYAKELLLSRLSFGDASGTMFKSLLKMQTLAQDVPAQLSQILMDLEGGKFRVHVQSGQLDRLVNSVHNLGMMLLLGMCASAMAVGGFFLLSRYEVLWNGVPIIAILALVSAGMFLGAAFTWYLLAGRLKKISLQRWIKKT